MLLCLVPVAIVIAILAQWKLSGTSLPLGFSRPASEQTRKTLAEKFPGVKETTINSIMKKCYNLSFLDTSSTYEEFLKHFKNYEELQEHLASKTCPEEEK